jgi:hypothetical protein
MSTDRATTYASSADRSEWGQPRPRTGAAGRDGMAMTALRVTTYVLTSLASVVFLALVVYGGVQLNRLQSSWTEFTSGLGASPMVPFDTAPGMDYGDPLEGVDEGAGPSSGRDWSCTFAVDGVQVCEGNVPPSVGEYMTPEQYNAGN